MSTLNGRCLAKHCGNKNKGKLYCPTCISIHKRQVAKAIKRSNSDPETPTTVLLRVDGARLEGHEAEQYLEKHKGVDL